MSSIFYFILFNSTMGFHTHCTRFAIKTIYFVLLFWNNNAEQPFLYLQTQLYRRYLCSHLLSKREEIISSSYLVGANLFFHLQLVVLRSRKPLIVERSPYNILFNITQELRCMSSHYYETQGRTIMYDFYFTISHPYVFSTFVPSQSSFLTIVV